MKNENEPKIKQNLDILILTWFTV